MILGFDIETNGLSPWKEGARILTAAVHAVDVSRGVVMDHPLYRPTIFDSKRKEQLLPLIRQVLEEGFTEGPATIVGHNLGPFDVPWWEAHVGPVNAKFFDTRVAYALIDENAEENSLAYLAEKYLGEKKNPDGLDRRKLEEYDPELVLKYNAHDAMLSYRLHAPLVEELERAGQTQLFNWLMSVSRVLATMQVTGVALDRRWVEEQGNNLHDLELRSLDALQEMVGSDAVNFRSTKQLAELMFETYRMPVVKRTATGAPSTDTAALKELRMLAKGKEAKAFITNLLEYRRVAKLRGTYLEPLVEKHLGTDGRVHTTYHLGRGYGDRGNRGGTVTGRLSSSDPNLQNIPRDVAVKGAFIPGEGLRMFAADYSQIELRVAAWYAGEESMLQAFRDGRDVHTATLAELEGVTYEHAVKLVKAGDWEEKRALVKRVNFGVLYGVGEYRLVQLMRDMGINITVKRAKEIITWWYGNKKAMARWIDATEEQAVNAQQVVTPTGRVRHLPDANWDEFGAGAAARRQAVNFMVQSFSADIMLSALGTVARHFENQGGARPLLTVHDSIVGEYDPEGWGEDELKQELKRTMLDDALLNLEQTFGITTAGLLLDVDIHAGLERWLK